MGFRSKKGIHTTVRENLSAYVDREADAEAVALIESHLAACDACAWEEKTLEQTRRLMGQAPRVAVPRSFVLRRADVEAVSKAGHSLARRTLYLRGVTALVGVLLFAVVAGDVWLKPATVASPAPEPPLMLLGAPQGTESLAEGTAPSRLAVEATPPPAEVAPLSAAEPAPAETPTDIEADALEWGKTTALGGGYQGAVPEPGEVRAHWWESANLWRAVEGVLGLLFVVLLAVIIGGARRVRRGA